MTSAVGGYVLEDELGRGGMGRVFRARHQATGAARALKVLDGAADAESILRFRREAEALARASGPGTVAIHETGFDSGKLFFVMDLMPGGSLRARLAAGRRLPWREAAALVARLARTMERCHAAGLVHRDLKPENVLFDEAGEPRIADFGCVRDLAQATLTETGTSPGTVGYMAPEQLDGRRACALSDVFALGVILHELVTGERPFAGGTWREVLLAILQRRRAPVAPAELEALLARTLAIRPEDRPASAGELASALEALLGGKEKKAPPRSKRSWALAGSLAALLLLAAASFIHGGAPAPVAPSPPVQPRPNPAARSFETVALAVFENPELLERSATGMIDSDVAALRAIAAIANGRTAERVQVLAGLRQHPAPVCDDLVAVLERADAFALAANEFFSSVHADRAEAAAFRAANQLRAAVAPLVKRGLASKLALAVLLDPLVPCCRIAFSAGRDEGRIAMDLLRAAIPRGIPLPAIFELAIDFRWHGYDENWVETSRRLSAAAEELRERDPLDARLAYWTAALALTAEADQGRRERMYELYLAADKIGADSSLDPFVTEKREALRRRAVYCERFLGKRREALEHALEAAELSAVLRRGAGLHEDPEVLSKVLEHESELPRDLVLKARAVIERRKNGDLR